MEKEPPKPSCSYCGKSQRQVRKLIAGPTVYICDECIKLCNDLLAEPIDPAITPAAPGSRAERSKISCSFCGKNLVEVRRMISSPSAYICNECVGLCNDIISDEIDGLELAETGHPRSPEKPV